MAGLVISELGGGDYAVALVDDAMWAQIQRIPDKVEAYCQEHPEWYYGQVFPQWVGWIVVDDKDEEEPCPKPDGCPDREGTLVKTWYCQSPVIEPMEFCVPIFGMVFI